MISSDDGSQISVTSNTTNTALRGGMRLQQHWDSSCMQRKREDFCIKRVKQEFSAHADVDVWSLSHPVKGVNS